LNLKKKEIFETPYQAFRSMQISVKHRTSPKTKIANLNSPRGISTYSPKIYIPLKNSSKKLDSSNKSDLPSIKVRISLSPQPERPVF